MNDEFGMSKNERLKQKIAEVNYNLWKEFERVQGTDRELAIMIIIHGYNGIISRIGKELVDERLYAIGWQWEQGLQSLKDGGE